MISRFIAIRNIGKFVNCSAAGDVTFRKLTLIFGENGKGKTTIGDILRSLSTGNPEYILGRATLGAEFPPYAQVLLNGDHRVNFKDGKWDGPGPRLAIYDSTFINDNVHSGNSIDREHRKNLYGVIVGEEGVAHAKKVDDYDAGIREVNKDITAQSNVVKAHLPQGLQLEAFIALTPIPGLEKVISGKRAEVGTLERAQEIKEKAAFTAFTLPALPPAFEPLMGKVLEDISKEAEAQTKRHLETHIHPGGEPWIAQGLSLSNGEQCPFCGQNIRSLDLMGAFKRYFSASYADFKRDLSALQTLVGQVFGENGLLATQRALTGNASLATFWSQFVDAGLPAISFDAIQVAMTELRRAALNRVKTKLASPLEMAPSDGEFERASESYREAFGIVANYGRAVVAVNDRIAAKKKEMDAGDLAKAKVALGGLLAVQKRFDATVDDACGLYLKTVNRKGALETEKADSRKKLDEHCKQVFVQYEKRINELLVIFGAGFRIGQTKPSFAGGTVSSSFQIVINKVAVDLGNSETASAKACFRNTLSAGDRSTLALAFFIAKLEFDPKLAETVVLLDDPFTSQDRSRRRHTQRTIHRLAGLCRQVVVFSHDPFFLRRILHQKPAMDTKVLQVSSVGEGHSKIEECEINVLTRSEYLIDYTALRGYLDRNEGDARLVAPAIRRVLESYLRMKQPMAFRTDEWLGQMIGKIRIAAPGSPLHGAQSSLDSLDAINEYSQQFHHGDGTEAVTEIIDTNEFRTCVEQTLRFVEAF